MELSTLLNLPLGYVLPFLVALTVIVFVHEYGHFKVARMCGVKVEVFSVGFGREIVGWNDRHGTRWKICWLPLGGYVKFEGDANASSLPSADAKAVRGEGNFHGKPVWKRAAVVAAGPLANFVLAIFIFAVAYYAVGIPYTEPRVDEIMPGSAAEMSGIQKGDFIRKIDGTDIRTFSMVQENVWQRGGEQLNVVVERGGGLMELSLVPKIDVRPDGFGGTIKIGMIGVRNIPTPADIKYENLSLPMAVVRGAERTWYYASTTLRYLGKMFTGSESINQIGGPVAMAKGAGDTAANGFVEFAGFVALLSVSIGLINLFPIPMLDGGHLVYYALEAIRGKPLGAGAQEWGFRIGLSFVVMLMLVGVWNDIMRTINMVVGG
jgi:regulator of sigma E protease